MAGESFASSGTSAVSVWADWNVGYASATTTNVWTSWTTTTTSGTYYYDGSGAWGSQESAETRTERERKEKAAHDRAHALFRESLSPSQRREVKRHRYFTVESRTSKRRYRIRTDRERHGNIEEVNDRGEVLRSLCGAPGGSIPIHDALLGQKLFLEHAEAEFLEKANVTERRVA